MARTAETTETLVSWLNDAYGLEHNLIQVLEHRVKDVKGHPDMEAKIRQHLEQTRRHADLVKGCIESLGASTSSLKSGIGNVMGALQGRATEIAKDEMVKNALTDYASEQFEIASYRSLIAAAEALGENGIADICRQILRDEEDMAQWLNNHIPTVTREYLAQQATA